MLDTIIKLTDFTSPYFRPGAMYENNVIGTSDCNDFVPLFALGYHNLLEFETGEKVLEYNMPNTTHQQTGRQYRLLFNALKTTLSTMRYTVVYENQDHHFYVNRGCMYDSSGNIMMIMGINSEYLMNTPMSEIEATPNPEKLSVFVSTNFVANPMYKNVYKKFGLMWYPVCRELGIDIVETKEPKNWVFKNNFEIPQFRTVTKLKRHLKEVPAILIAD